MQQHFKILKITRANTLALIATLSMEQLNKVPKGFNNNIAWNVAHLVVIQQLLIYKRSNTPTHISNELIERFKKGSSVSCIDKAEWEQLKITFIKLIDNLEKDYSSNSFNDFVEYQTSYNIVLKTIEDAIIFNNTHEALHLGYIMALKRAISA